MNFLISSLIHDAARGRGESLIKVFPNYGIPAQYLDIWWPFGPGSTAEQRDPSTQSTTTSFQHMGIIIIVTLWHDEAWIPSSVETNRPNFLGLPEAGSAECEIEEGFLILLLSTTCACKSMATIVKDGMRHRRHYAFYTSLMLPVITNWALQQLIIPPISGTPMSRYLFDKTNLLSITAINKPFYTTL